MNDYTDTGNLAQSKAEATGLLSSSKKLHYQRIDDSFYFGMRNELTSTRFDQLAYMADKIPLPKLFGTFVNDQHYLQTLELLLAATEETRHRGIFFIREVLPRLACKDKLLDIGTGSGVLINWIGRQFKNISLVDTSLVALETIHQNIHSRCKQFARVRASILEVDLLPNYYDLAILSHTLYYIESKKWFNAVNKVYDSVKVGGLIVIVLNGGLDKASLIDYFKGNKLEMDVLIHQCSQMQSTAAEVFVSNEKYLTREIDSMLHIAGLHLYDAKAAASRNELIKYLRDYNLKENSMYEIAIEQTFLVLKKLK